MSELEELIRINRNIENQNREIIRLLKIIAGQSDFVDRSGYVFPEIPDEIDNVYENADSFDSLLEVTCDVGEVYFIDEDIFRLKVENDELSVDNLMGNGESTNLGVAETVSRESIRRNQSLDDSTVILTDSSREKLPQTLELCYNQGAEKVFIPWNQMMELIGAPDTLQRLLKLNFYKSEDDLIEKIFGKVE
ncbi:hypothetical protein [Methanobrevibacter sp.]|uniref:hypothetical protein n=1 Tax=Methanobrevibacter sp. TaxID=66852 RepID=UPI00386C2445